MNLALRTRVILVTGLLFAGIPGLLAGTFSLEEILGVPYPRNLVVATDTDRIAWVLNDRGVRNIWTAAGPGFEPVKLTAYSEDDGQTLSSLRLTPDGSHVVYVRGGAANKSGEHPNPTSHPDGAEQAIWIVATKGGEPRKLADGSNPVVSPGGEEILFSRQGEIWHMPLEAADPNGEPTEKQLFKARGRNGNAGWSPDGGKILFASDRGDHSFIGVYDREKHSLRWIAPGVDRDIWPVWSPDGRRVAFIRLAGLRGGELMNLMSGAPFSIHVSDLATDETREIWRSPGDDGMFAQYYPSHPLRWTKNERILFYSEHDGWMHIYSVDPSGGDPIDLTPGPFEAETSAVSADGTILFFSGNHEDIDRRHIWSVPTEGGEPTALTREGTIDTHPAPLSGGQGIVYRSATARRPQSITMLKTGSNEPRLLSPASLPSSYPEPDLIEPRQVVFTSSDRLRIHGQLFMPEDLRPGDRRPALIFMHGGPIRQMLLGWHYGGYYAKCYGMNQYTAGKGYVVLAVNFRGGIGYGRDFRLAENQGPRGASEYRDIIAAGRFLRSLDEVDPERIGLWGGSYGGYLTAMGLARDSDLFAAGVDLHGVHDWSFRATDFSAGGGWGLQGEELMELAHKSSPVADLSYWSSPVLFIHGDDDRNVLFQQTTDLVQRLRERKVQVETLVFPDEVHGFLRHGSWLRALNATADFFDRFLSNTD